MNTATTETSEANVRVPQPLKINYLLKALFQDTYVSVEDKHGNKKNASYSDFFSSAIGLFSDQLDNTDLQLEKSNISWPINTLASSTSTEMTQAGDLKRTMLFTVYFPAFQVELRHRSTKYKDCSMPNILITFELTKTIKKGVKNSTAKWDVRKATYLCTPLELHEIDIPKPVVSRDHRKHIYTLAMPNMYGDGRMCYGANTIPSSFDDDVRGLTWYHNLLFESPFNSDLSVPGLKNGCECPSWLGRLRDKSTYPYWQLSNSPWDSEREFLTRNDTPTDNN